MDWLQHDVTDWYSTHKTGFRQVTENDAFERKITLWETIRQTFNQPVGGSNLPQLTFKIPFLALRPTLYLNYFFLGGAGHLEDDLLFNELVIFLRI